jgi:hypothetical protein
MGFAERHAAEQRKAARRDAKYKADCAYGVEVLKKLSTKNIMGEARAMPLEGAKKLRDPSKPLFKQSAKRQGFKTP